MKETSEITPSELLADFNNRGLKRMIIFTIVVHVVLILATSGSFIMRKVTGSDSSKLGESERTELAVKEAESAMRRIAEQHGLKPQDLSSHFTATTTVPKAPTAEAPKGEPAKADPAKPETPKTETPKAETPQVPDGPDPAQPEKPKSTIENELKTSKPGPAMPTDEDLFK